MKEKNFKTYDYTTVTVRKELEPVYMDMYESFGWELTDNELGVLINGLGSSAKLSFKRDRKINNKTNLIRLQKRCEELFRNIDRLESEKTSTAMIKAFVVGIIGIVFLALSVFMITGYLTFGGATMFLQVIAGAIGILLCIPPYFIYRNTVTNKTAELDPLIDEQYDKISEICEEANTLIKEN